MRVGVGAHVERGRGLSALAQTAPFGRENVPQDRPGSVPGLARRDLAVDLLRVAGRRPRQRDAQPAGSVGLDHEPPRPEQFDPRRLSLAGLPELPDLDQRKLVRRLQPIQRVGQHEAVRFDERIEQHVHAPVVGALPRGRHGPAVELLDQHADRFPGLAQLPPVQQVSVIDDGPPGSRLRRRRGNEANGDQRQKTG